MGWTGSRKLMNEQMGRGTTIGLEGMVKGETRAIAQWVAYGYIGEQVERGWKDRWLDGVMDVWVDGRMDR